MNNFYRALRLIFRYKWTLAASCFTAIMVAVLWGANIGGAYPVIGIITNNQSLQQWVDASIDTSQKKIADLQVARPTNWRPIWRRPLPADKQALRQAIAYGSVEAKGRRNSISAAANSSSRMSISICRTIRTKRCS